MKALRFWALWLLALLVVLVLAIEAIAPNGLVQNPVSAPARTAPFPDIQRTGFPLKSSRHSQNRTA